MLDLDLSSLFRGGGGAGQGPTVRILTVCTGNICRSPLAEQVLRTRLAGIDAEVSSAGTHALVDRPMTRDAAAVAASFAVSPDDSAAHRARWLTDRHLSEADLVLAMTREHRTHAVELAPARTRATFTAREFARLSDGVADEELRAAAEVAGADPHARLRAVLGLLSARRGEVDPPADPADDDVIDPYRRPRQVYEESAAQLAPGLDAVVRVVRAALA